MAKAEQRRVFFALWPGLELSRALHGLGRDAQRACSGRPMRRETLHLTLAFLGGIPAERVAVAEAAAASIHADPFEWQVDRLGFWKHNHILWAGGESPALAALAAALGGALREAGFQLEARAFAAHITLLRNARCAAVPELGKPLAWAAQDFVLVESLPGEEGSRYEIIGRWPLAIAAGGN